MTDTEGYSLVEATYAGRRESYDGKTFIVFYLAGGKEDATFSSPKSLKLFRNAVIGGVYTLQRKDNSFIFSDKFLRASGDTRTAEWKAADTAFEVTIRARKVIAAEKAKGSESITVALAPFRAEYAKTNLIGRLALEVVLLNALRRGG